MPQPQSLDAFIDGLPKAELHLHIEGSLEPELMFELARRNGVSIPFDSVEAVRAAYDFSNLQDFLDIYYAGANVLLHRRDFEDLAFAYFRRAAADNVRHAEIFFDPQTHTDRGVAMETVIEGLWDGMTRAETELGLDMDACTLLVVQDAKWKYVHFTALPPLLFDLEADPGQFRNLADDPNHAAVVKAFAQKALSWRMLHADRTLTHYRASPNGLETRTKPERGDPI